MQDFFEKIETAASKIRPYICQTPLEYSSRLSDLTGAHVYLKNELFQYTGSFKLRGALNKILSLPANQSEVIAASTGNHGLACAYAAKLLNKKARIYLPSKTTSKKKEKIKAFGAELIEVQSDCLEAELKAREDSQEKQIPYISPYNDLDVIIGQGTLGKEVLDQAKFFNISFDALFISVGGGGLISGVGSYLKRAAPQVSIVGCWPYNSQVMYQCMQAGKIIEVEESPSLSSSTMGGIEEGSLTLPICQQVIDQSCLVSEEEIRESQKILHTEENLLAEGSAALTLACLIKEKQTYQNKTVVLVLCGRN